MTAITPPAAAAAAAGWLAAPPPHHPSAQRYEQLSHHPFLPSFLSSSTTSYHSTAANIHPNKPVQQRTTSFTTIDTTCPLPQKRRRLSKYANAEAQQAARLLQKAKRREQNRIAQRRLRDRKEEHIFKLEGDVAVLRRQSEEYRSEAESREELVRRLIAERDVLLRRLEVEKSSDGRTARPFLGINALGLVDVDREAASSSSSSSMSNQSTSASISTPKSPTALFHSPLPIVSKTFVTPRRNAPPTYQLPKVNFDPTPTPPLSGTQWNHAH